jgi:hypothetical protein
MALARFAFLDLFMDISESPIPELKAPSDLAEDVPNSILILVLSHPRINTLFLS